MLTLSLRLFVQSDNHLLKHMQAHIDALGLGQDLTIYSRLEDALRTCQIDQVQTRSSNGTASDLSHSTP
jgi:hypothetical protein